MTDPKSPSSRRDFLKVSGAVAAGLAIAPNAHAAGVDSIKVGLIGCGGRGSGAVENLCEAVGEDKGVKIFALADVFPDNLNNAKSNLAQNGKIAPHWDVADDRCFTGFDAYLKLIDSGVDLVILATPPGFRPMMIEAAVKAGKNVFTEKTLALTAPASVRFSPPPNWLRRRGWPSSPEPSAATRRATSNA